MKTNAPGKQNKQEKHKDDLYERRSEELSQSLE